MMDKDCNRAMGRVCLLPIGAEVVKTTSSGGTRVDGVTYQEKADVKCELLGKQV